MLPSLERLTLGAGTDAILISDKPIQPKELKTGEKRAAPDEECAICGDEIGDGDGVYLECEEGAGNVHLYHNNCLRRWHDECARRGQIFTCPICREEVVVKGKTKFVHEADKESYIPPLGLEWIGPPPATLRLLDQSGCQMVQAEWYYDPPILWTSGALGREQSHRHEPAVYGLQYVQCRHFGVGCE